MAAVQPSFATLHSRPVERTAQPALPGCLLNGWGKHHTRSRSALICRSRRCFRLCICVIDRVAAGQWQLPWLLERAVASDRRLQCLLRIAEAVVLPQCNRLAELLSGACLQGNRNTAWGRTLGRANPTRAEQALREIFACDATRD